MNDFGSNIEREFRTGAFHGSQTLWRAVFSLIILCALILALRWAGVSTGLALGAGLGAWAAIELGLVLWRIRRSSHMKSKAVSMQSQLHELNRDLTALRVEEAKARGDFDRFGEPK